MPAFVEVASTEDLFRERFSVFGRLIDFEHGPIAPAREQEVVELREFGFSKSVAAIEDDIFLS